jgi:hypothetical protein
LRWFLAAVAAVAWTIVSVPLGLFIWPAPGPAIPAQLLPIIGVVLVFEGAAFAAGLVVLVYGGRLLASFGQAPLLTRSAYLSIAWLLLNWWPHDGLHRSAFGRTYQGLPVIDITFHATLIVAGSIAALFFIKALKASEAAGFPSRRDGAAQHEIGWRLDG